MLVENMSLRVGTKQILDDVSIPEATMTWLIGVSGAGKTSVLDGIAGITPMGAKLSGILHLGGESYDLGTRSGRARIAKLRRNQTVGWAPQNAADTFPPHMALKNFVQDSPHTRDFGLTPELLNRKASQLSGGQLARVSLAAALAHHPQLVLADEPTAGLENELADAILRVLLGHAERGEATMGATHDLSALSRIAPEFSHVDQQVAIIRSGVVVEAVSLQEFIAVQATTAYGRAFARAMPENGAHPMLAEFDDEVAAS